MAKTTLVGSALAALLLLGQGTAQSPNLSGDWKMNPSRSDYGPLPVPDKLIQKIDHNEPALHVTPAQAGQQGEFTSDLKYTIGGKICVNQMRGNEARSTLKWSGRNLVVDTRLNFQGNQVGLNDEWTLSDGGKTLTILRHINSPQGELDMKIVLEKQ